MTLWDLVTALVGISGACFLMTVFQYVEDMVSPYENTK